MLKLSLLLSLYIGYAFGAVANFRALGTTHTQGIVSFRVVNPALCTLVAYTDSARTIKHNDTNNAIFSGSEACNRAGNLVSGLSITAVVGKRSADIGADAKLHSRALAEGSTLYVRVTDTSDSSTYDFTLDTRPIPIGATHIEAIPVTATGGYGWPSLSWTDRTQQIIDPQTGALIRRISLPRDGYEQFLTQAVAAGRSDDAAWANPGNVTSTSSYATFTGAGRNWLFVDLGYAPYGGAYYHSGNVDTAYAMNWLQTTIAGFGAAAGAADRAIEVCLGWRRGTCVSNTLSAQLPTTVGDVTLGGQNAILADWFTGDPTIDKNDIAKRTGTVNCTSTTIDWVSGEKFNPKWASGDRVTITGTEYTISSVTSEVRLVTTAAPGCSAGAAYAAANLGLLVRKATTTTDQISVRNVRYSYENGSARSLDASGASEASSNCSATTVAGPGSEQGWHCSVAGQLAWIGRDSGSVSIIGPTVIPAGGSGADAWQTTYGITALWSRTDANSFHALVKDGNGDYTIILKATYTGSNADIAGSTGYSIYTPLVACGSSPCWTFTNLTPASQSKTIPQLIETFVGSTEWASFPAAAYSIDLQGDYIQIQALRNNTANDQAAWYAVFNPSTGAVIAAMPSWRRAPARWAVRHGVANSGSNSVMAVQNHTYVGAWSGTESPGRGPFLTTVASSIGSTGSACPSQPGGNTLPNWPSGSNCVQVTVDGEPCDPSPGTGEATGNAACGTRTTHHYLQSAIEGDVMWAHNTPSSFSPNGGTASQTEFFRLLIKSGNTWTLQRAYKSTTMRALTSNWSLVMVPANCTESNGTICFSAVAYWDFATDPQGTGGVATILTDATDQGSGHGDTRAAGSLASVWANGCPFSVAGVSNNCYFARQASSLASVLGTTGFGVMSNPPFEGKIGWGEPNAVDSHPSYSQHAADSRWATDARPWLGAATASTNATLVTGSLYKWTAAQVLRLNRKYLPTFASYGGAPMLDVSGPSAVIEGTSADAGKYCVAVLAGECAAGSSAGDVYFNAPQISALNCPPYSANGGSYDAADTRGVCIGDSGPVLNSIIQIGIARPDASGHALRVLTRGFSRYDRQSTYWNAKTTPDGKWLMFWTRWAGGQAGSSFLARMPRWRGAASTVPGFRKIPVPIAASASATHARVRFGYDTAFRCTTDSDSCLTGGTPFSFAREAPAPTSCSSGCTIDVPAIPGRVLYYRIERTDSGGTLVAGGATQVADGK